MLILTPPPPLPPPQPPTRAKQADSLDLPFILISTFLTGQHIKPKTLWI